MQEIVIPIPTAVEDRLTYRVKRRAADRYGGFTAHDANGGWRAPNGDLITEPVEVLTVLVGDDVDIPAETFAKVTARHLASESDEQEIMWFVREVAAGGFETSDGL